jgi:hypothetical protein
MTSVGVPFVTVCFSIVRGAAARTITGFTKSVAEFILGSHAAVASVPPEAAACRSPSHYLVSVVASESGGYTSIRTIFVGRTVKKLLNWFTEHKVMRLLQRTNVTGLRLVRLEYPTSIIVERRSSSRMAIWGISVPRSTCILSRAPY